jgi:hypothetical protein
MKPAEPPSDLPRNRVMLVPHLSRQKRLQGLPPRLFMALLFLVSGLLARVRAAEVLPTGVSAVQKVGRAPGFTGSYPNAVITDRQGRLWVTTSVGEGVVDHGLAQVKRLIEGMGGSVGVESIPGHGATFWIALPRS